MKAKVTSILNSDADTMWNELQNITSLKRITFPVLIFKTSDHSPLPEKWHSDRTYRFRLFLLGIIPLGHHTINFEVLDPRKKMIISNEHGLLTRKWKHLILLQSIGKGKIRYTDEVEIKAGILTFPVWFFAQLFYRYRQRRWKKVLKSI
ncbi:MAG: hypothetical protein ACLFQB_05890 [Chitinispirillaceae bacterium]